MNQSVQNAWDALYKRLFSLPVGESVRTFGVLWTRFNEDWLSAPNGALFDFAAATNVTIWRPDGLRHL